jgi:type VI secretion system protein ImpH
MDLRRFDALRAMLEQEPFRVQFFQAVRLLQRMERSREPVGYFKTPQNETIRFSALPSLAFPASELYDLQRTPAGQLQMTVQFMGVCAAVTVLPSPYTELVLQRIREKDRATAEFFNFFEHRILSFFYRGWEKYRFYIGYEHSRTDAVSPRLMDLLGLGIANLKEWVGVSGEACLNYVGLLGRHVRSAAGLEQILSDYFIIPVEVHQFAGTWRRLSLQDRTCFSGNGGPSERLGVGVIAGDEVWDHHGRIRVSLGPMPFEQYLAFLPGEQAYYELCSWLRFYSNGAYETEVELVLERTEAPGTELGAEGPAQPRLGLVSWLKTRELKRNPADATYLVQ